jgi:hypothetical protein
MVKRLGVLGVVIGLLALVISMIMPAAAGGNDDRDTFRVVAITTEQAFLDLGATDFGLGDEFIFHDDLRKDGNKIGHNRGVCTVTSVEEGTAGEFQCDVTFSFEKGQIATQGLAQPTGEFPDRFSFPITGGSGKYEGAGGEIDVVQHTETRATVTFHFTN